MRCPALKLHLLCLGELAEEAMSAKTYADALRILSSLPVVSSNYFILAGADQGAIVTRFGNTSSADVWSLNSSSELSDGQPPWLRVQTNADHWVPYGDTYATHRRQHLLDMLTSGETPASKEHFKEAYFVSNALPGSQNRTTPEDTGAILRPTTIATIFLNPSSSETDLSEWYVWNETPKILPPREAERLWVYTTRTSINTSAIKGKAGEIYRVCHHIGRKDLEDVPADDETLVQEHGCKLFSAQAGEISFIPEEWVEGLDCRQMGSQPELGFFCVQVGYVHFESLKTSFQLAASFSKLFCSLSVATSHTRKTTMRFLFIVAFLVSQPMAFPEKAMVLMQSRLRGSKTTEVSIEDEDHQVVQPSMQVEAIPKLRFSDDDESCTTEGPNLNMDISRILLILAALSLAGAVRHRTSLADEAPTPEAMAACAKVKKVDCKHFKAKRHQVPPGYRCAWMKLCTLVQVAEVAAVWG
eukprot:symbB.v1.2.034920.t2/scaffold4595.1/size37584/1